MADATRQTFRVTLDVTVAVREMDDTLVTKAARWYHTDAEGVARDPDRAEGLARDRRLMAAILRHPEALRRLLLRHVAWSLESVNPKDGSLEHFSQAQGEDTDLLADVRDDLPADDMEFLLDVCEEGIFYDNTTFFQEAFAVEQQNLRVEPHAEPA